VEGRSTIGKDALTDAQRLAISGRAGRIVVIERPIQGDTSTAVLEAGLELFDLDQLQEDGVEP
jgi:hypothetical protein